MSHAKDVRPTKRMLSISAFGAEDAFLPENIVLANEGWVDYQSHGFIHNENMTDASADEFLKQELQGSKENLQTQFNKTPVAIIWPGGNFGLRPVLLRPAYRRPGRVRSTIAKHESS